MKPILLLWLVGLASCLSRTTPAEEPGTWEGTISIGPLCPVEPCKLSVGRLDTIYRSYRLPIIREKAITPTTYLQPTDHNGQFSLTLEAGTYVIRCDHCLQKAVGTVRVLSGQTTRQDVRIDTGIR